MVTVRPAVPDDAEALVALLRELLVEPGVNIPLAPDEVTHTVDSERLALADLVTARTIRLVAAAADTIVGEISLRPVSSRRALAHVATLGISVARTHRNHGVGGALMTAALERAPAMGFSRIELNVYARNAPAIALYERFGFEHEGRRRRFIKDGDAFLDDLLMARLL